MGPATPRPPSPNATLLVTPECQSATDALIGLVAHEVRNPLFSLSATIDAFYARHGHIEEYQVYFSRVQESIARLNALMQDLLEYGKPLAPRSEAHHLPTLVDHAVSLCLANAARVGCPVEHQADRSLPVMLFDAPRVINAVHAVLESSLRLTPPGTTVTITTTQTQYLGAEWQHVQVHDQGPSIAGAGSASLPPPFAVHRPGSIGLGMAIAQRVMEWHRGQLSVEDAPQGGVLVTMRFPVSGLAAPDPGP